MENNGFEIIDNFLDLEELKRIQDLIFSRSFSWHMPPPYSTCHTGASVEEDFMYFNHFFFDNHIPLCKSYHSIIVPILRKLNSAAPIDVKSLVIFNRLFDKCDWHRDHFHDATTTILYLNNCNGGTELKINDEIKFVQAKENRVLIFPSQTDHRPCTSTDVNLRYIINFNYFK